MRRLYDLRKRSKITQKQLADKLGVARSTISNWESGKFEPDLDTIINIAKYFGVPADYLLGGSNEIIEQLSISEQRLIITIRKYRLNINEIIDYVEYKAISSNKK